MTKRVSCEGGGLGVISAFPPIGSVLSRVRLSLRSRSEGASVSEAPDQTPPDQEHEDTEQDDGPVVDGRESANEVAEELKEQEDKIEQGD